LNLDAPLKDDEIPGLLEKLEKQLEDYNQKVKDWEANREAQKSKILAGEADTEEGEKKEEE